MNGSVNKCIFVGNLGADPETKVTPNETVITTFSMATSYSRNHEEHTEWHKIKLIGRLAEIADKYLQKGSKVYIESRAQTDTWLDNQTQEKRSQHWFIGTKMEMLGNNKEPEEEAPY